VPSFLQMRSIVDAGELLPDSLMLEVLNQRLAAGQAAGEAGVLLDGFPRTRAQVTLIHETQIRSWHSR
jgi:adenylate kinase